MRSRHARWCLVVVAVLVCAVGPGIAAPAARASAPGALGSLDVAGAGVATWPAFDPAVRRYALRPGPSDSVVIAATATEPGAEMTMDGVPIAAGVPTSVHVTPGDRIRVEVVLGPEVSGYELVVLPRNFPQFDVMTLDRASVGTGELFLTFGNGADHYVVMADAAAVPLQWKRESRVVRDFKRQPDGTLSYNVRVGAVNQWGRGLTANVVLDAELNEMQRVTTVGLNHTDSHEFHVLPGRRHVVMGYVGALEDLTSVGGAPDTLVEASAFQVLGSDGSVEFSWSSWPVIPMADSLKSGAEYAHLNSIHPQPDGDFLLSLRGVSQVVEVDGVTGAVHWRLGGVSGDLDIIGDPWGGFCGQHTASRLPNGNVLLFDNGTFCPPDVVAAGHGARSRAVEYQIDEENLRATMVWQYHQAGIYGNRNGSAQRLPNGNTLIGWGDNGMLVATEVTASGATAFELAGWWPDGSPVISYRVTRGASVASCDGLPVTVDMGAGDVPTPGDDVILGTAAGETIDALGGNDVICAGEGSDVVRGGAGDDVILGGGGSDTLVGNAGADVLYGGDDRDFLAGGPGGDTMFGDGGDDHVIGGHDDDVIEGGDGDDYLRGTGGNDTIRGGPGADRLFGETGNDALSGDGDNDGLYGGAGDDTLRGGDVGDTLAGNAGADLIYGDGGDDTVFAGADNDIVDGGAGRDTLDGQAGHDSVDGGTGSSDRVGGGTGVDSLSGGSGTDDTCDGGIDADTDTAATDCELLVRIP